MSDNKKQEVKKDEKPKPVTLVIQSSTLGSDSTIKKGAK